MKKNIIAYPLLFGAYPVLTLFAHNINTLDFVSDVLVSLVLVMLFVSFLWVSLSFLLKDKNKASLMVSLFAFLFFVYGPMCKLIEETMPSLQGTDLIVLAVLSAMFLLGVNIIRKQEWDMRKTTVFLNAVGFVMVASTLVTAAYNYSSLNFRRHNMNISVKKPAKCPNIYYIILDGYARSDIMSEIYNYDNGNFKRYLSGKGFYVADESVANYSQTRLSLASSLNFNYLDDLVSRVGENSNSFYPLVERIHNSDAVYTLRKQGYKFVSFYTGYLYTDIKESDVYMAPVWHMSEYQSMLISFTPLSRISDLLFRKSLYDVRREQINYSFNKISSLSESDTPVFVFDHIVAPHDPFLFGEHGEPIKCDGLITLDKGLYIENEQRAKYISQYRGQAIYVTKMIKKTVDEILSKSKEPPIIIIQADHGPGSGLDPDNPNRTNLKERMRILNAYYLPQGGDKLLYPGISPVNTFRVVFDYYFGASLKLLDDRSYFSTETYPYRMMEVTNAVR